MASAYRRFLRAHTCRVSILPSLGSMQRKITKVVEGCWYNRLKVVPGSCSKYSDKVLALALADMAKKAESGEIYNLLTYHWEALGQTEEGG